MSSKVCLITIDYILHYFIHICFLYLSFVNWFGNTNTFRYFSVTESLSKSFWTYSQESMHCLKSFLPHYYNKMTRLGNVFELRRAMGDGDGEEGASSDQVEVQIANGGRMGKRGVGWEDE